MGALLALARIVRFQLGVLAANAAGLRAGGGVERLHDARVALRRLRSLLGQLEGVLEVGEARFLTEELHWLAARTGPARDLDVLRLELGRMEPALRRALAPLRAALAAERTRQLRGLVAAFDSRRGAELLRRLGAIASAKGARAHAGPRAAEPFAQLLGKRLRRRLRQVRSQVKHADAASPAAELHALRIACKKLRYLLECCRGLVPERSLARIFRRLKELQTILGMLQDTEVQLRWLSRLGSRPALRHQAGVQAALGRVRERLAEHGRAARARYADAAEAWLARTSRAELGALLEALDPRR